MKRKLLMAALFVVSALGFNAKAQTDVTDTYLTNAGFELGTDGTPSMTSKGFNTPYGWTSVGMPTSGTHNFDILSENATSDNSASKFGFTVKPAEGSYYYLGRHSWQSGLTVTLSQNTKAELPAGDYAVDIAYKIAATINNVGGHLVLTAKQGEETLASGISMKSSQKNSTFFSGSSWNRLTVPFTVASDGVVNIQMDMIYNPGAKTNPEQEAIIIDDVKLYDLGKASASEPVDVTGLISPANSAYSGWTSTTNAQNKTYKVSDEKNNGEYTAYGFVENWKKEAFTGKVYYSATGIPAGHYKISAYAFDAAKTGNVVLYANTEKSTSLDNSTDLFSNPTIEDFIVDVDNKLEFGLDITGEGTNWTGITGVKLLYKGELTVQEEAASAKVVLKETIETAQALATANVGDAAFKIDEGTEALVSFNDKIDEALIILEDESSNLETVTSQIDKLNSAIDDYKKTEITLNGPADGSRYVLILNGNGGWTHDGKAVTYIANSREDHGLYNIQYLTGKNANYAQAFMFIPAGETNTYYLMQIDNDGKERYVSTGVPHGGNTAQIRTVMEIGKALKVKVISTATDGIYNIYNTEANNYIGSQDAGFFTVNSHINFNIVEASEAEVAVSLAAGKYATRIFPFIPTLPEGVKAYTFGGIEEGNVITLNTVDNPTANVPYILENTSSDEVDITLSGYGLAKQDVYTADGLTGSFAESTTVPAGNYVLQTLDNGQKFYRVGEETAIEMPAYRAYLTIENAAGVKAFSFGGETTGINGVETLTDGAVESIYTINGTRVNSLQKGLNIVKMSNGKTQKVLVK